MSESSRRGLLPAGMRDILPPDAAFEAETVERLMAAVAAYGYDRVKPPLVEFEDSLLAGSGAAMAPHSFRLMDPVSQRMMALRADMTLQIARIAATRLKAAPRPLRLSYAGQVLRVMGDTLRPERQFGQVGAELIGSDAAAADAEAMRVAAGALLSVGLRQLTIDISLPDLVPIVAASHGFTGDEARGLRKALDRKDTTQIKRRAGRAAGLFLALMRAAGPAGDCLAALKAMTLPRAAKPAIQRAAAAIALARIEGVELTIDPVEMRGFEYHTGLCFTLFADRVQGELGRGGRYVAGEEFGAREPATGFTLFADTLLRALPGHRGPARVYVPFGAGPVERLHEDGFVTVAGLARVADSRAEAKRLGCTHVLEGAEPRAID